MIVVILIFCLLHLILKVILHGWTGYTSLLHALLLLLLLLLKILQSLLLKQLHTIVHISLIGSLLFILEFVWILTVLSEELADALGIVAKDLVIVGKAQELGHINLRLALHHFEKVRQSYQVLITCQSLLILKFEEHIVLATLVDRIKDFDDNWNENEQVGQSAKNIFFGNQCDNADDCECNHQ